MLADGSWRSAWGGVHTLKVGHVGPDIRIQSIDDHLAVGRACDLDAPVHQSRRWRSTLPRLIVADMPRLGEEVEQLPLVKLGLANYTSLQEGFPALVECAVQQREEDGGIFAEDVPVLVVQGAEDVDLAQLRVGRGSHDGLCSAVNAIGLDVEVEVEMELWNAIMYACGVAGGP